MTAALEISRLFSRTVAMLVWQIIHGRFRFRETVRQQFVIGWQSLPVLVFSITIVSLMLVLEFSYHMKLVLRQNGLVPAFSTLLLFRELGPVVVTLLMGSRMGAGIAAELAIMRNTEQLDALQLLGVDRIDYLFVPRWIAVVCSCLCLTLISLAVSTFLGSWIAAWLLDFPSGLYFQTLFTFTRHSELWKCLIKVFVFSNLVAMLSIYHGIHSGPGAEGVGNAATAAVVRSSVFIVITDFVLTYWIYAS